MKKIASILLLALIALGTMAQESNLTGINQILQEKQYDMMQYNEQMLKKIKGTPYLSEEFLASRVYLRENNKPLKAKLKYNAHSDNFEFMQGGRLFVLANVEEIDSIRYMDKTFIPTTYVKKETGLFGSSTSKKEGFLAELVKGPCSLFKIYSVRFYEEDPPDTGYDEYQPPRFETENPVYCLQFQDDQNPRVINSFRKRKILEKFENHKKEMEDYVNNQNLNLREESDLVKLISHYNKHYTKQN
jgi:hypothetical protein